MENKALRYLACEGESKAELLSEIAPLNGKGDMMLKLQYIGKMEWADKYGIDSRMWNVVSPRLPNYDYSAGGLPTFTMDGLKERGLI